MRYPITRMLRQYGATGVSAYGYVFEYESPYEDGLLGACHTLELPFVFGNQHLPSLAPYIGTGPTTERVARSVQAAWTGLAINGEPVRREGVWPVVEGDDFQFAALTKSTTLQCVSDRPEMGIWDELQVAVTPTGLC